MKKLLAILALMTASSSAFAEPTWAPESSVWTKIDSFEDTDGQTNIEGYIVGSSELKRAYFKSIGTALNHCHRSLAMMMDKPGKYSLTINFSNCTLRITK